MCVACCRPLEMVADTEREAEHVVMFIDVTVFQIDDARDALSL